MIDSFSKHQPNFDKQTKHFDRYSTVIINGFYKNVLAGPLIYQLPEVRDNYMGMKVHHFWSVT